MRLKCIKLAGFKSFVDPTTVHFPSNLCAVVGPNGCGKSNIIDAVRWVMGESSAKNLRGEAMTDVIFNGSNSRKPIGQASIELVFDNSDGKIAGEYASYSEISVKRKVTRDSQNLYYLNGNKCRRRDITDIFLGTGLGPRSYAIIEQGMISRLIEARPEDLRIYVEEAAGISKYKERRRDTENRMRRTHENLERLTDIRDELERQISRLERQAQAAEKYKEYKETERELKATLQAVKYRDLQAQADIKQQAITALELDVEAAVTTQVHHDATIEKQRVRHAELGDRFNEVQGRYYSVGAEIARLEQTIQHIQEREKQLKRDLEQTVTDCAQAQEHLDADLQKSEGWSAELLEIEPEVELLQETEAQSAESLLLAEEAMQQWQQEWDKFNQKAAQPKQQAEVQQSRIQYLEQIQQRLLDRLRKLESETQSLIIGDSEAEIAILQEQLAEIEMQLELFAARAEQSTRRAGEHRIREQQLQSELSRMRENSQQAKGRRASLEALQQAALGQTETGINEWMMHHGLHNAGRVAEILRVESGWEKAVETVLGSFLQGVCVDSLDNYAKTLEGIEHGDVILLDTTPGSATGGAESLLARIRGDGNRLGFLENVLTADTLEGALGMRGRLSSWQSVVTRDGIWIGPNWIRVAREKDTGSGVLARQQELDTLGIQIAGYDEEIATHEAALEQCKQSHIDAEHERDDARSQADQLLRQQNEVRNQLTALTARVEQILEGRRRATNEIAEVREQLALEGENLAEARGILQEAIDIMEQDTGERERLLTWRDELRAQLDSARQKARRDKDRAHELALRYQSVKTQLDAVQQGIMRLREQMQRMVERREGLQEQLQNSVDPIDDHRAELEDLLNRRVAVEDELNEARRALEDVETGLRQTEKLRHQLEQGLQTLRVNLEKERLDHQSLSVQCAGFKSQLDEAQFDLDNLLTGLSEEVDEADLAKELEQMNNRIGRLGAINLAAIDEYKTESERKRYLDAQNQDLQEALETLENAIKKIDRETRSRFKETFDQINNGLQELFPKVFGGGHAYLELTGEDLLDTGIAIMARPPGKRNSTIHLLSGGEKALTAIALVFSIFRLNPAPFCMLDEVDAPLDDANVGRYARMVNEMSEQVQFIYITHNKIAMEMAHQLMGVTMHEPGVSRMVTVDVEEAAELAVS